MSRTLLVLNLLAGAAIASTHASALLAAISPYRRGAETTERRDNITTTAGATSPNQPASALRVSSISCPVPPLDSAQ
jgi:hypothetical protein